MPPFDAIAEGTTPPAWHRCCRSQAIASSVEGAWGQGGSVLRAILEQRDTRAAPKPASAADTSASSRASVAPAQAGMHAALVHASPPAFRATRPRRCGPRRSSRLMSTVAPVTNHFSLRLSDDHQAEQSPKPVLQTIHQTVDHWHIKEAKSG